MTNRSCRVLNAVLILLGCFSLAGFAGNTYLNNFANIEVSEPDWYEFSIDVSQSSGSSAALTIRAHDVDEESGELDEVYLNGHLLGYLSGTNDTWSTTAFDISSVIEYGADNLVRVWIDPGGGESTTWVAELDWGQILVDGGSAEDANITSIDTTGPWNAIQVQTGISATSADTYRLEINLLDSSNNNKDIAVDTFTLSSGQSTTRTNTVSLPSEPSGGETFTVEANLFNDTTDVQQSVRTTTWTSASEPPTDILLSNDALEENAPVGATVGTLSAVDPDSVVFSFTLIDGDVASFSILGNQLRSADSFDFETQDSYSIRIQVEDEDENAYDEWFTITVDNVNEAPAPVDDSGSVNEGDKITVDVLANDADPDSDTLQVSEVSEPSQGSAAVLPDETIEYIPDAGACGTDSFSYTVQDGNGGSSSAEVTITIANLPPIARADIAATLEDESVWIDVLANDVDSGGGVLVLDAVSSPTHGIARIAAGGIRYTPQPRFEGKDHFTYTVRDACGETRTESIEVEVVHKNEPPVAHAGGIYQGIAGQPLVLDASFSHDPDLEDVLHFRWDLDGDGSFDTPWTVHPQYEVVYDTAFYGSVTVEVRDVYRGMPTGETSQATALVRIASVQSIQIYAYEDVNGDGERGADEPGLAGLFVLVGETKYMTQTDGGISVDLEEGSWDVSLAPESRAMLQSRGFTVSPTAQSVSLGAGAVEVVLFPASKISTTLKGSVYVDANASGELDENDLLLQGLRVTLDDNLETLTDDAGQFFFLSVPFGEHILWIGENIETDDPSGIPSLTIPVLLERGQSSPPLAIAWPWTPEGPGKGFLQVDIKRTANE